MSQRTAPYERYHQIIGDLSRAVSPAPDWEHALWLILKAFEVEIKEMDLGKATYLCTVLCDQFESEALRTRNLHSRRVLLAAVKRIETMIWQIEPHG